MTLAGTLAACRRRGRAAFVPFLAAGDPSLAATAGFVRELERSGADILELGVPFSDPVADGPAIQRASLRALRAKTTLSGVLRLVGRLKRRGLKPPVVLFTYLNPLLSLGVPAFARRAAQAGVDAVLVVDLPAESSGELGRVLAARGIELVLLASPTTSDRRLALIGRSSGSIVYYVSREGVTGVRRGPAPDLRRRLARARRLIGKPLIVGFGIASPEQARALAEGADGVVVGSALVELIAGRSPSRARRAIGRLARSIARALEKPTC